MKVTQSLKRAAIFVADVLHSVTLRPFLKKHGIKDKEYGKRLVHRLRTTFSLAPAPRSGRPAVYKSDELQAAKRALVSPGRRFHNTRALVASLKEEGELATEANMRGFKQALKRQLAAEGVKLGYGTRSKAQALSAKQKHQRLVWCQEMRTALTDTTVKHWLFEDEKPHSFGGKAKCESCFSTGVCSMHCCPS
jgi:hypothetical protein